MLRGGLSTCKTVGADFDVKGDGARRNGAAGAVIM